jgi:serine/threonine protein kinase
MPPADSPDRPAAPTDGHPPDHPAGPDPHTTVAPNNPGAATPDPLDPEPDEAAVPLGATVVQTGPPSHLLGSPGRSNRSSDRGHSGREVRRLERLIDRSRDAGAADLAPGYKLLDSIGTGAFGSVWQAEYLVTGEHVAIKFFAAGDEHWGKLLDEVRRLQELEGSHGIVMVKQVSPGGDGRPPYYVMQLANRGSLADRLDEAKAAAPAGRAGPLLPQGEAVRVFSRVAEAMAAVHRRGVHHCDLKPRNVLLHRSDPGGPDEPLVADFGQAHLATDDTPALGTFFYMPPDQAAATPAGALPDTRWDVYALGAVLYEMLTGEPPRRSGELVAKLKNTEHLDTKLRAYCDGIAAAPPPVAHRGLVDPMLAAIVDRCLELDPGKRPQDAGDVVRLLRQRAWWRQTRPILALATAAAVVFVLLLAGLCWAAGAVVFNQTREQLTHEVKGNLARTAWFGGRAIEHQLHTHVEFIERTADELPLELRDQLAATANAVAQDGPTAVGDRKAFDEWVGSVNRAAHRRWPGEGPARTIALVLAAGDPTDPAPGHAFTLSRTDGQTHPAELYARDPEVYRKDWSFHDYFNGVGTVREDEGKGRRHPIAARTRLSRTSQSRQDPTVWQASVVTPVWSSPDRTGRVVALISIGLKVNEHLGGQVRMPEAVASAGSAARSVAFLVDDADRWVWYPDAMEYMEREAKGQRADRDPDSFRDLAARFHPDESAADYLPWRQPADPQAGWSGTYTDLVQAQALGDRSPEIAHVLPVYPFERSRYPDLRGVRWAFVVQVDEGKALEPLAVLRYNMIITGSVVVVALAALAAGLWAWLIRVLRGREFVTHG